MCRISTLADRYGWAARSASQPSEKCEKCWRRRRRRGRSGCQVICSTCSCSWSASRSWFFFCLYNAVVLRSTEFVDATLAAASDGKRQCGKFILINKFKLNY